MSTATTTAVVQEIQRAADTIRDARQVSIVTLTDGRTALWVR